MDSGLTLWGKLDRSLLILLVCSLFVKLLLATQAEVINPDGIRYINSAHELFRGNIAAAFSHDKMLGFTFLLGLSHWFIPDWHFAGKVLSSIALVLATIPLYLITQEIFNRRAAFCTALTFTFASAINGKCTTVIKDPTFLLLIVFSLWLLMVALKESRWCFSVGASLIASLSVLIRPEGIVFIFVALFVLVVLAFYSAESRSLCLKTLVAFCSVPVICVLALAVFFASGVIPQETWVYIYAKFAHYFRTDQMQTYMSIYKHLASVEGNFPGGESAQDFFEFARHNIYLIYLIGMLQTFLGIISPLYFLPLCFGLRFRNYYSKELFLLMSVMTGFLVMDYLFLMTFNFLANRYLLLPVVLSFVLVGYGMDKMIMLMDTSKFRTPLITFAILLCFVFPLARTFYKTTEQKSELRHAGVWLSEHRDLDQSRLIVNEERIAYHAGLFRGEYDTVNNVSIVELEQVALNSGSDLFVAYLNKEDDDKILTTSDFVLVESFPGRKKVANIYERKNDG